MLSLKLSLLPAFIMAIIVSAQKIIYNVNNNNNNDRLTAFDPGQPG